MFTGSEHASYIALCRELRLEREFEDGDYYTAPVPLSVLAPDGFEVLIWVALFRLQYATEECVWLPRLDQWLAMLEAAGEDGVMLVHAAAWGRSAQIVRLAPIWCASYEESCARLWMAAYS